MNQSLIVPYNNWLIYLWCPSYSCSNLYFPKVKPHKIYLVWEFLINLKLVPVLARLTVDQTLGQTGLAEKPRSKTSSLSPSPGGFYWSQLSFGLVWGGLVWTTFSKWCSVGWAPPPPWNKARKKLWANVQQHHNLWTLPSSRGNPSILQWAVFPSGEAVRLTWKGGRKTLKKSIFDPWRLIYTHLWIEQETFGL